MSNIIDKIQLSGVTYDIGGQGGSGVSVVEVTQAEYDALPSSAKTDTSKMYVITDAEAGDLTNYYTKTETNSAITEAVSGKVDSDVYTAYTAATDAALANKQTTLTAGTGIDITDNVISATGGGGGGKAVTGGTNISVVTGETADTINCTLPISVGGSFNSCLDLTRNTGNRLQGSGNVAFGAYVNVTNSGELGFGRYNISNTSGVSPYYNNPNKTLFSVGNGTADNARHNAFEIRQNGDIYLTSGGTDIKLQDHLGGGGGGGVNVVQTTGTSTTDVMSQDAVTTQLNGKADKTTAARGLGHGNKNTHSVMHLTNQNGQEISGYYYTLSLSKINDKEIVKQGDVNPNTFSLVETSAITTSISSSSTDAQVPSAKAVYDIVGNIETLLSQI